MTQKITPQLKRAAHQAMVTYVRELAEKVPAGTKAAEVQGRIDASRRLSKLANQMAAGSDVFSAVRLVFAKESEAYRHNVARNLVRGLQQKLASMGATQHPSAKLTGLTSTPGSGKPVMAPASQSIRA